MSDRPACEICDEYIYPEDNGAFCGCCYNKQRADLKAAKEEAEEANIEDLFPDGSKVRLVVWLKSDKDKRWMVTANIGGWKMGETATYSADTLAAALAAAMRDLTSEVRDAD